MASERVIIPMILSSLITGILPMSCLIISRAASMALLLWGMGIHHNHSSHHIQFNLLGWIKTKNFRKKVHKNQGFPDLLSHFILLC